eukprot:784967-Rhodomonas_salina.11
MGCPTARLSRRILCRCSHCPGAPAVFADDTQFVEHTQTCMSAVTALHSCYFTEDKNDISAGIAGMYGGTTAVTLGASDGCIRE